MMKFLFTAPLLAAIFTLSASTSTDENTVRVGSRPVPEQAEVLLEEKAAAALPHKAALMPPSSVQTTHLGVMNYPMFVTPLGDQVTIQDGSIWDVRPQCRLLTFNWLTSDAVVLTQNFTLFSSYQFLMKNLITHQDIEVNLAPLFTKTLLAYTIVQIDPYLGQLCLSDGSVWELNSYKKAIWGTWYVGDMAIIGINSSLFWGAPNILIDAQTNSYVEAKCIY